MYDSGVHLCMVGVCAHVHDESVYTYVHGRGVGMCIVYCACILVEMY